MIKYNDNYETYVNHIEKCIVRDLEREYKYINFDEYDFLEDKLRATNDKFIFLLDEWDYIFNSNIFIENHEDFLSFLRTLLKDKPYVSFCYMTGILPIKKHSNASSLNMFEEYTFLKDRIFEEYFGFTESEVKVLD